MDGRWRRRTQGDLQGGGGLSQTKQRLYEKDLAFSYYPFLPILGSGLVTANGTLWQKQRLLIAPALRLHILVRRCPRPPAQCTAQGTAASTALPLSHLTTDSVQK